MLSVVHPFPVTITCISILPHVSIKIENEIQHKKVGVFCQMISIKCNLQLHMNLII